VSPILVRPVREQLEHDRIIRLLQLKLKRKIEVTANIGEDQSTPVKIGQLQIYPDLLLTSADRHRKLLGTVEVETSESVNHLEARAQWAHLGKARAPFHLYVPAGSVDIARRLATENHVNVTEIWTYHTIGDQTHFKLAQKATGTSTRAAAASTQRANAPTRSEPRPAARPRAAASRGRDAAEKKRPSASRTAPARSAAKRVPAARRPARPAAAGRGRTAKPSGSTQKRK
jgi:hypothetical protein